MKNSSSKMEVKELRKRCKRTSVVELVEISFVLDVADANVVEAKDVDEIVLESVVHVIAWAVVVDVIGSAADFFSSNSATLSQLKRTVLLEKERLALAWKSMWKLTTIVSPCI